MIERRFGLDGDPPETHKQIAKRFGVSVERIRQIEQKALRRLRYSPKMGLDRRRILALAPSEFGRDARVKIGPPSPARIDGVDDDPIFGDIGP